VRNSHGKLTGNERPRHSDKHPMCSQRKYKFLVLGLNSSVRNKSRLLTYCTARWGSWLQMKCLCDAPSSCVAFQTQRSGPCSAIRTADKAGDTDCGVPSSCGGATKGIDGPCTKNFTSLHVPNISYVFRLPTYICGLSIL
jgi:hypothetical protein